MGGLKSNKPKRNKLAEKVMQVTILSPNPYSHEPEVIAEYAYRVADAMIKESNKPIEYS